MTTFSVLNVGLVLEDAPADVTAELATRTTAAQMISYLRRKLHSAAIGNKRARLSVRNDSVITGANHEAGEQVAPTITITHANVTAGETIVIGNVTLTWAAAAANENEVTIGADLAADTTNLTSKINAHSVLGGIFSASGNTATGVVTVTYTGDPRIGQLIGLSETGDAVAVSASSFASDATEAKSSATYQFSTMGVV